MVLIVEDDPLARRALESLFAAHGYVAHGVPSAEAALDALSEHARPGMILIDIDLPGMSGLELLRRLQNEIPELPCTLMSAADHDLSSWSSQPVVPFLPKPLNVSRLFSVVRDQHTPSSVA